MKKLLVSLAVVASAVVPAAVVAAPASAAPVPGDSSQTAIEPNYWADVAWFYYMRDCVAAGEYGRARGTWGDFSCTMHPDRNPDKPVLLRADYR